MKNAALYESAGQHYLYKGGQAGETTHVVPPAHLELLLPILAEHDIDCLWIMPQTELSRHIAWSDFERIDQKKYRVFYPQKNGKPLTERPAFVSLRRQSEKWEREFYLAFPAHGEWSAYDNGKWFLNAPYVMGCTVNYLTREFGLDVAWGPGNLGMKALKRIFVTKDWQIENLVMTDQIETALNQAVTRPVWRKYGGLDQKRMKYLHGYDKNSQYLGAAQSVYLGNGQPEIVGPDAFSIGTIGFWEYELLDVGESAFDGYDLPCPLSVKRNWASTNLLVAARELGIEFEVLSGIVWRQPKKYLEEWAKEMRKHRENLGNEKLYPSEIARENAIGTAKMAANSMMGRLATPGMPGSKELYRPDWNMMIIQQAVTNQMYSFRKILRDYGIKPVLVVTDSWWIASDEPDPDKAIPNILKYQHEQRGYKHVGTIPMTPQIADAFTTQLPEDINSLLKKELEEVCYA